MAALTSPWGCGGEVAGEHLDFADVIHADGVYLAAGQRLPYRDNALTLESASAVILRSTDGRSWSPIELDRNLDLRAVAHGNGRFVAVGGKFAFLREDRVARRTVLTSTDGEQWSSFEEEGDLFVDVAFGNDRFVAIDFEGVTFTSSDGQRWDAVEFGPGRVDGVEFGIGAFMAFGADVVATSSTGQDWSRHAPPIEGAALRALDYAAGRFFGAFPPDCYAGDAARKDWAGRLVTSDGVEWSRSQGSAVVSVAEAEATLVGVDIEGNALVSTDGVDWQVTYAAEDAGYLSVAAASDDLFVVAGRNQILASPDGQTWTVTFTQ